LSKEQTSLKWIETGYHLFAHEGPNGIHIEKIARLLELNKSSFYHHFGTLEVFYEELVHYHYQRIDRVMKDVQSSQNLDPDYLYQVIKHKITFLSQVQFVRHKGNPLFAATVLKVNQRIDQSAIQLWKKHVQFNNDELALKCLSFLRDTFYARVTSDNFNYTFLQDLLKDSKYIVDEIAGSAVRHEKSLNGAV